jgi:hypothetical protein
LRRENRKPKNINLAGISTAHEILCDRTKPQC